MLRAFRRIPVDSEPTRSRQDHSMRRHRFAPLARVAAAVTLAAGCATMAPPTNEIANADLAIKRAEQASASQYAPLEMQLAREKLDQSRDQAQAGGKARLIQARRLAEESLVQAQLAEAVANNERAKANKAEAEKTIESLRDGMDGEQK